MPVPAAFGNVNQHLTKQVFFVGYCYTMPARKRSPKRPRSPSQLRKRPRNRSTPKQTGSRVSPSVTVQGVKYVDPSLNVPGVPWAMKHGFIHVRRVSQKDARIILEPLNLTPDEHSDAFGTLIFGNPWGYLQKFAEAGGDFHLLGVRQKGITSCDSIRQDGYTSCCESASPTRLEPTG